MERRRDYVELARSVMASMDEMRPEWEWLSKRILPRQHEVLNWLKRPADKRKAEHCAVAAQCANILASSYNLHITPSGQKWFEYATPDPEARTKYEVWYGHATEVALNEFSRGGFYAAKHETALDAAVFGTGCLFNDGWRDGRLHFRQVPVGSFGIAENADRVVDTLCREFHYTAVQAVERFGRDALPAEVLKAYERPEERVTRKFVFWHLVTPRREYVAPNGDGRVDALRMPFASVYLYGEGRHELIEEGGYMEFPFMVHRFLLWGESVWGYPPAHKCLEDLERYIQLDRAQDMLADLALFPRVLMAAEQVGEVDFRAGGKTVVNPGEEGPNLPREWLSGGDLATAKDRMAAIEDRLRGAFLVNSLQVFGGIDRRMTAAEVYARKEEKIVECSPAYSLYCELLDRFIGGRVFNVLFRAGKFNTEKGTPPGLMVKAADGESFDIAAPKISFHGRINIAIDQSEKQSLDYGLESLGQVVQMMGGDASVFDCVDMDKLAHYTLGSCGAPSEIFREEADVEALRARREQERQAALAVQMASAANQGSQAERNLRG